MPNCLKFIIFQTKKRIIFNQSMNLLFTLQALDISDELPLHFFTADVYAGIITPGLQNQSADLHLMVWITKVWLLSYLRSRWQPVIPDTQQLPSSSRVECGALRGFSVLKRPSNSGPYPNLILALTHMIHIVVCFMVTVGIGSLSRQNET